jgi:hypothetical protein
MSMIMDKPQVKMRAKRKVTNIPDQIAGVKNGTSSTASLKDFDPALKKNGSTYNTAFENQINK